MSTEKTSWPEMVGWPATAAVTQINTDRPDVSIEVLPSGASVTPGFNGKRVLVDATEPRGLVVATPLVS